MRFDLDDPEIKPFRIYRQKVEASLYNCIRLGILRNPSPLVISLPKSPHIKCHLTSAKWVLLDTTLYDFPLLVWRDFEPKERGLHEPVECKVYVYHNMAGRLMGTGLYELKTYIESRYLAMT